MRKSSFSRSAFFNPRVLIGFVICSIGLLLAMAGMSATTSAAQSPSRIVTPLCFAAFSYGAGTGPSSVGTGDFNLDGSPDLAITNATSNDVSILLNMGMARSRDQ